MKLYLVLALVLSKVVCSPTGAGQPEVSEVAIRGDLELSVDYYPPSTNSVAPSTNRTYTAKLHRTASRWYLATRWLNTYDEYYCDGSNTFVKYTLPPDARPPAPMTNRYGADFGPPAGLTNVIPVIYLVPGTHPLGEMGVNVPWLAVLSDQYLKNPGRLLPLPSGDIRHNPGAFGYRDLTTTFPDVLGLPERVTLILSRKLLKAAPSSPTLIRSSRNPAHVRAMRDIAIGAEEGLELLDYRVTAATNLFGWNLPSEFLIQQRYPIHMPGSRAELMPYLRIRGTARFEATNRGPDALLRPSEPAQVTDFRFRHPRRTLDCLSYLVSDGRVPPVDDPELQQRYRVRSSREPVDALIANRLSSFGLYLILLGAPAGVAIVGYARRRSRVNQ